MGEVSVTLFKSLVKVSAIFSVIVGFVTLFALVISGIMVALNYGVIEDLLSLVQMWAPFNLDPILLWLGTAVTFYMTYRVAMNSYIMIKSVVD